MNMRVIKLFVVVMLLVVGVYYFFSAKAKWETCRVKQTFIYCLAEMPKDTENVVVRY